MKVLLTKKFLDSDIQYITGRVSKSIELIIPASYDETGLLLHAPDADVLMGGFISEELLKKCKNLKFIQVPWTGVDNLNFELLKRYNVTICNSHSNALVVAEHAIAMMFDAAKKLSYHDRKMRKGDWNRIFPGRKNTLSPFSKKITGSKVGLIGYGAIGKAIHNGLRGFNCNFKIYSRSDHNSTENISNASYFKIENFKSTSNDIDFLIICVPLTQSTKGFVNRYLLSSLNKKCILVNISRGQVINQSDLFEALSSGNLLFAAIDTWCNYPTQENPIVFPSKEFEFHLLENILLSPHRAGYIDSGFPHLDDAIENLNRFVDNRSLKNIISLNEKY